MRINKISQKMFETFGLEDQLVRSFNSHYNKLVRENKDPQARRALQKMFNRRGELYLGAANIGASIKKIMEHHGIPVDNPPNRVHFFIGYPGKQFGNANAYFMRNDDEFYIIKMTPRVFEIPGHGEYDFQDTIEHELQHVLKSLYSGEDAPAYAYEEDGFKDALNYYSNDWEIQSFALSIARMALDMIQNMYGASSRFSDPQQLQAHLEGKKDSLAGSALKMEVKKFLNGIEESKGVQFPDKVRQKYYQTALRDFYSLFDKWVGGLNG